MRKSDGPVPAIHLGTSSFTAAGWEGAFYPAGMKPADYLHFYAQEFDSTSLPSGRKSCARCMSGASRFSLTPTIITRDTLRPRCVNLPPC